MSSLAMTGLGVPWSGLVLRLFLVNNYNKKADNNPTSTDNHNVLDSLFMSNPHFTLIQMAGIEIHTGFTPSSTALISETFEFDAIFEWLDGPGVLPLIPRYHFRHLAKQIGRMVTGQSSLAFARFRNDTVTITTHFTRKFDRYQNLNQYHANSLMC